MDRTRRRAATGLQDGGLRRLGFAFRDRGLSLVPPHDRLAPAR